MKKFTHKLIAIVLCMVMIAGMLPMAVHAEGAAVEYTLYPTPHSVVYNEGSFELDAYCDMIGEGIDEYTVNRLNETFTLLDLPHIEGFGPMEDATNVYVAIYGSGDEVEQYILDNYDVDTTLFNKTDANFVAVNDGEIVVLGKDTDAAFYGLTTLYQIFGQLSSKEIRNLTINDYADVASRGFIEGYYGNPWSTEDRINLMTWGGYYKLNSYFYAPKDDPKHNSKWRELYTAEEIEHNLKLNILCEWNRLVREDLAEHPIRKSEVAHLTEAQIESIRQNPTKAYGTTLGGAMLYGNRLICVGLGDGGCFLIRNGEIAPAFPEDEDEPVANITYSLCGEKAFEHMNARIFDMRQLDGVLLCTDGVLGPYQSTENFKRSFVRPVVRRILDDKTNEVKQFVCDLGLRSGIGDDVSLAMVLKDTAKPRFYR